MAGRSASVTDPEVVGPGEGFSSQRASLEQITRGEIDIQIATARRFPRSITAFHTKAISLVTLSKEIAESCIYALPRKDRASGQTKMIKGPSIRFAEIVQSSYQNIRSLAQPVGEEAGFVTVRGLAWDIENNSVIGVETRRKITTSSGHRYSDDMVTTTVNAGSSIVLRNAILHVIPQPLWMPIYEAAVKHAVGDQKTLSVRRQDAIEFFKKLGVPPQRVFARLGVAGIADIDLEKLEELFGLATAIKDNAISIDDAFADDPGPSAGTNEEALEALLANLPATMVFDVRAKLQAQRLSLGQAIALLRQHAGDPDALLRVLDAAGAPAGASTTTAAAKTEPAGPTEGEARTREMPSQSAGAVGGAPAQGQQASAAGSSAAAGAADVIPEPVEPERKVEPSTKKRPAGRWSV